MYRTAGKYLMSVDNIFVDLTADVVRTMNGKKYLGPVV